MTSTGKFVGYYRVSTSGQGASGLGLEAQKSAVLTFLNGGDWSLAGEFVEVESGKRVSNRPELGKALEMCRLIGATLVIAKLDRLSRDAHFLLGLEAAGVNFVAADMPHANRLTVRLMAVIAQEEREMISRRTIEALAAAKARGVKLGGHRPNSPIPDGVLGRAVNQEKANAFAMRVRPSIEALKAEGHSLNQIAKALNDRGVLTAANGRWTATAVRRVLLRQ